MMSHSNISVMQQCLFFLNKSNKVLMAFVNQLSTVGVLKKDRKAFQEQYNQVYYMQYEEYTRHLRKCFVNFFRSLLNPFRCEA